MIGGWLAHLARRLDVDQCADWESAIMRSGRGTSVGAATFGFAGPLPAWDAGFGGASLTGEGSMPLPCVRGPLDRGSDGPSVTHNLPRTLSTALGKYARGVNLPIDFRDEASRERFAICCRRHENREGPIFSFCKYEKKTNPPILVASFG
jgi:hypothetical protein